MTFLPPNGALKRAGAPIDGLKVGIQDADPQAITTYADQLAAKSEGFKKVAAQMQVSLDELARAWPHGASSKVAQQQLQGGVITQLLRSADELDQTVGSLRNAANVIQAALSAYSSMVAATNPTVAGLLTHPATRAAGKALAHSVTASLSGFFSTAQQLLQYLGMNQLAGVAGSLNSISTNLETVFNVNGDTSLIDQVSAGLAIVGEGRKLFNDLTGSAGLESGAVDSALSGAITDAQTQAAALTQQNASVAAGLTANAAGLPTGASVDYQSGYQAGLMAAPHAQHAPSTGAQVGHTGIGGYDSGYAAGYAAARGTGDGSGLFDAANNWVAVDPGTTASAGSGATSAGTGHSSIDSASSTGAGSSSGGGGSSIGTGSSSAGGGDHAVITSRYGDTTVSVELPTNQPTEFAMTVDTNGSEPGGEVAQKITIGADRRVTVA